MGTTHFNFTDRMRDLCSDMSHRLNEVRHIDFSRIAVAFAQARKRGHYGTQASLTPLRFEGGSREGRYRGRKARVQSVTDPLGREMLYVLTFYLPRFLDLPFDEKLITIFHELWHISPEFDGDLRRHDGRCYAHTHSQAEYDARMGILAKKYLALNPPSSLYAFLQLDFEGVQREYGKVIGVKIPRPKLIFVA